MQFEFTHTFSADRKRVEELMLSDAYCGFVASRHRMLRGIDVLANEDRGDKVFRRVQYTIKPFVDRIGPKPVPPNVTSWIEESVFDKKQHTLRFENIPVTDWVRMRLRQDGMARFEELPGGRCRRVMRGGLEVMLLGLLGKIVEHLVVPQARKLLDEEVHLFDSFLREKP